MERLSTWVAERKKVDVHIVAAEQNRQQSVAEEIANSISHGIGLIAAIVRAPILKVDTARNENGRFIAGASVFCATMIMLYFASTVYYGLPPGKAKRVFRVIEHSAFFPGGSAGVAGPGTTGRRHGCTRSGSKMFLDSRYGGI